MNITPVLHNAPVLIADKHTPIVIPFGPACCGKTMLMTRLFRFLRETGYIIVPERTFLPPSLSHSFDQEAERILQFIYDSKNLFPHGWPLLFKIISSRGISICQFFDQRDGGYFDLCSINFPIRLLEVLQSPNKKIWLFMLELDWGKQTDRDNYVRRIVEFRNKIKKEDQVLFIASKIDKAYLYFQGNGKINEYAVKTKLTEQYPNLFEQFKRRLFLLQLFNPYTFKFCTFSSGFFEDRRYPEYTPGSNIYPKRLWELIMNSF